MCEAAWGLAEGCFWQLAAAGSDVPHPVLMLAQGVPVSLNEEGFVDCKQYSDHGSRPGRAFLVLPTDRQ